MELSVPLRFSCTTDPVTEFDVSSNDGRIVVAYVTEHDSYNRLSYSILNKEGKCALTETINEAYSISSPLVNFYNSANIAVVWQETQSNTIYANIDIGTKITTNSTICNNQLCEGLSLTSNSMGTIVSWFDRTEVKYKKSYENIEHTVSTTSKKRDTSVASNDDCTIIAWEKFPSTKNALVPDIGVHVFNSTNIAVVSVISVSNERAKVELQIAMSKSTIGLVWGESRLSSIGLNAMYTNIFFKSMNLEGINITDEIQINAEDMDTSDPVIMENIGVFAIGWKVSFRNGSGKTLVYGHLIYPNGTKIGTEFIINDEIEGNQRNIKIVPMENSFTFAYLGPVNGKDTITLRTLDITPYSTYEPKDVTPTMRETDSVTNTPSLTQTPSATIHETPTHISPSISITNTAAGTDTVSGMRTETQSISTVKEVEPKAAGSVPAVVEKISATSGGVASVASVASISVSNVAIGARINTVSTLTSCDSNSYQKVTIPEPSFFEHPLGFAIGDGPLKYVKGALVGNIALYIGGVAIGGAVTAAAVATGAPLVVGAVCVTQAVLASYFFAQIASSSATLIKHSDDWRWKAAGVAALVGTTVHSFGYGKLLIGIEATFSVSDNRWVSPDSDPLYKRKYGVYFKDYRLGRLEAFPVDNVFNIATGYLAGYMPEALSECHVVSHVGTVLYTSYVLYLAIRRPYISNVDNAFYISIATLQALPLMLRSVQDIRPELKDHEGIEKVVEWSPVVANAALTAKTVYDIGSSVHKFYQKSPMHKAPEASLEDGLLALPSQDGSGLNENRQFNAFIAESNVDRVANPLEDSISDASSESLTTSGEAALCQGDADNL